MSNKVIDALTQLEKAIGLEPLVIPANIADLVTPRKFTGTEFLKYVGEEYAKQKTLSPEKAAVQRDYLAGMIAVAKMSYISDGATQAPLPTVQDYTQEAMVAWRAYQVRLEPVAPNPANAGGTPARAYKSADGVPEPLTLDIMQAAFAKMLKDADLPAMVAAVVGPEVVKAMASLTAEPEAAVEAQVETAQTAVVSVETPEPATDHWAGL
ncbi:MAG: hypothetical protein E6R03_03875 [Hyphomicrobiaceae bacterium]|nr:MAG: hypothetical protein E6R03_03875 [Hyphomicrobiaceae bacterium]